MVKNNQFSCNLGRGRNSPSLREHVKFLINLMILLILRANNVMVQIIVFLVFRNIVTNQEHKITIKLISQRMFHFESRFTNVYNNWNQWSLLQQKHSSNPFSWSKRDSDYYLWPNWWSLFNDGIKCTILHFVPVQ